MRIVHPGGAALHRANNIRAPLFIAHGATDPRVPLFEAEPNAATVESNDVPLRMFVPEDEGHGFKRRQNRDVFYKLLASVLYRYLQQEPLNEESEEMGLSEAKEMERGESLAEELNYREDI